MKVKLTLLFPFFIITVLCITKGGNVLYNKYESLATSYRADLNQTFHQAVLLETQKRIVDFKIPLIRLTNLPGKRSEYASRTTVSGTVYFKRTEEYERLSSDEKFDLFLQTYLAEKNKSINVNSLNQIWLEKLKEKKITDLQTGIKYRHRNFAETVYSDQDSLFFVNSSRINWYITGRYEEIDLQGHYNFSIKSLYQYAKKDFLVFILIGGILLFNLLVCFFLILQISPLKLKAIIQPAEENGPIPILDCNS